MNPYKVIIRPIDTEKTRYQASELRQYTFEVDRLANKIEVKRAVEAIYDVDVVSVNLMNVPAKVSRRRGRRRILGARELPLAHGADQCGPELHRDVTAVVRDNGPNVQGDAVENGGAHIGSEYVPGARPAGDIAGLQADEHVGPLVVEHGQPGGEEDRAPLLLANRVEHTLELEVSEVHRPQVQSAAAHVIGAQVAAGLDHMHARESPVYVFD